MASINLLMMYVLTVSPFYDLNGYLFQREILWSTSEVATREATSEGMGHCSVRPMAILISRYLIRSKIIDEILVCPVKGTFSEPWH